MEVVHIYKGLRDVTVNVSDDGDDWPWSGDWSVCRTNREMTKDLIKEEMMCRVYSFRPTRNCLYKNDFRGSFSCIYF